MRSRTFLSVAGAFCLGAGLLWTASAPRAEDAPADPSQGVDVQARGPVHEAYAEPAETRPEPEPVVPKQPPDPVQEVAPDQKPEGDNIVWIPGYWAWDDEATDFTWVSGFWRAPPPGREWTPGHWQEVDGGWQWVPGFWASQDVQQVEYLPPPPPSIDNGPSVPAPEETSSYVPGCWVYHETRYLWRPGYWVQANPDWCWIPDHYCWTPTGYLFVAGYWDYPLESRGLLFAPVRFDRRLLAREDFTYVPEYVVQPDFLLTALFVRPAYQSYYFGDYFEDSYEKHGFTPWVDYRIDKHTIDPNFAFYRHRFRGDDHWESTLRDLYTLRLSGDVPRPPRTWAQQTRVVNKITTNQSENLTVHKDVNITNVQNVTALAPIGKTAGMRLTGLAGLTGPRHGQTEAPRTIKLEAVPKEQQTEVRQHVKSLRELAVTQQKEQAKLLAGGSMPVKPTDPPKAVKMQLPKAPTRPQETKPGPKNAPPTPPPPPPAPKHEERPIPPHEPPTQSRPPKNPTVPGPKELPPPKEPPAKEPTTPSREPPTLPKEPPVRPKEPPTPPREPPTPPKEPPPPPPHREPPTPAPAKEPPAPPPPPKESVTPPPHREPPGTTPPKEPAPAPSHEPPAPPHKDKDKPPAAAARA